MGETPESLLKVVNKAGFLFQLRIEQEIRRTTHHHGWQVVGQEHHWADTQSGEEGFIDLVLAADRQSLSMAIECKRVGEGTTWVFLVPDVGMTRMRRTRLLWTYAKHDKSFIGWDDFTLSPESPESAFCVLRGQTDRNVPMLERLSGIVVRSLECLAEENLRITWGSVPAGATFYIPVIVTTAALQVCYFHPGTVSLENGMLPSDAAKFEEVPFIRFRKSLTTKVSPLETPETLSEANQESQRTVLVIHADALTGILEWIQMKQPEAWPWTGLIP